MMKNKKPEIRFKGFSEEWEDKELGLEVKITMGQSPNGENYTNNPENHILVQGNTDMKNGRVVPRVWTKQITKTANSNDLIFSVRAPVGEVGKTDYDVVIGRGVAAIEGNEFIFQFLKKMNENGYWNKFSAGSTFDSINSNDLSKAIISTTSKTEQTQIGNFFKNLDNLITLRQQKYEKLRILKKAMLEKMFPKNGADVPEIRFKGFSGAWKERTLGEAVDLLTGKPFESKKFTKSGILLVRGMNVKRGYLDVSENICEYWHSSNGLESYLLRENDIVIQMDGALIGKSYAKINEENLPALLVQRVTRIRCEKVDCDFIYQYIQKDFLKYISTIKTETAIPHLSLNDIRNFQIKIPSNIEQEKIGNYFKNLDNLLTLHKGEIGKLKNLKKAMLEKMFV